jgi:hypothetical protein
MNMCRFSGPEDDGYCKVKDFLSICIDTLGRDEQEGSFLTPDIAKDALLIKYREIQSATRLVTLDRLPDYANGMKRHIGKLTHPGNSRSI